MPNSSPVNLMPAISFTVDLVPVLLVLALLLCAASFLVACVTKGAPKHSLSWALGGAMVSAGLLLIVLRGSVPNLLSILFGNCGILLGLAGVSCGTSQFIGRRIGGDVSLGAAAVLVFALAYGQGADTVVRVSIIAGFCSLLALRTANGFYLAKRTKANQLACALAVTVCLMELVRTVSAVANIASRDSQIAMNGVSVSFGVPVALILAASVVMLHREYFGALLGIKRPEEVPSVVEVAPVVQSVPWTLLSDRAVLVAPNGEEVRLTGNEYMVLQKLGETEEPVDRLALNAVIGRSLVDPKDRGIDILLSRLRRKCADAGVELPINSLRGRGYVFLAGLQRL